MCLTEPYAQLCTSCYHMFLKLSAMICCFRMNLSPAKRCHYLYWILSLTPTFFSQHKRLFREFLDAEDKRDSTFDSPFPDVSAWSDPKTGLWMGNDMAGSLDRSSGGLFKTKVSGTARCINIQGKKGIQRCTVIVKARHALSWLFRGDPIPENVIVGLLPSKAQANLREAVFGDSTFKIVFTKLKGAPMPSSGDIFDRLLDSLVYAEFHARYVGTQTAIYCHPQFHCLSSLAFAWHTQPTELTHRKESWKLIKS